MHGVTIRLEHQAVYSLEPVPLGPWPMRSARLHGPPRPGARHLVVLARSRALRVGFILSPSATLRVAGQSPRVKVQRPAGRTTLARGLWSARPVLADGEWMDLHYLNQTAALVSAWPGPSLSRRPRRRRALTRGAGSSPRWCREDPAACRVGSEGLKQRGRQSIRTGARGGAPPGRFSWVLAVLVPVAVGGLAADAAAGRCGPPPRETVAGTPSGGSGVRRSLLSAWKASTFTICAIPAISSRLMRARIPGNSWSGWGTTASVPR
jgi:hypothetical protein